IAVPRVSVRGSWTTLCESCTMLTLLSSWFACAPRRPGRTYSLSLHDALPILFQMAWRLHHQESYATLESLLLKTHRDSNIHASRSEEHTSELQSRFDLVCRLLLEKKNNRSAGYRCAAGRTRH